ncbi:uncharacterized protein STEHIDRAFT_69435 [Stereum hirsutum FP-91666 SS1]|uniref:HAT C-terminal dimerisation domain-containing protein n=1 Tax=Stereum hirsutum (strain FP-91666) TaxID=721885 RepID=R7RW28_STEHR|nr:uncharacterized protein STEHIDRAFT_69435 [Stereum hirsutum FP-91666 SS1]EIM79464.1 hypothetical protein STEHIDRAFT_69435 [Stereum hirsutum FP-91666 SS1]
MADDPKFADLAPNIQAGLENMRKWYRSTDDSVAYFASMFFDPKWKDRYARKMWDEDAILQYDDYYNAFQDSLLARPIPSFAGTASATAAPPAPTQYGASWMAAAVDSDDENGLTTADKRLELRNYLSAPREKDATDIVAWWGLHSSTYPVLARMALDYLPIQGSASPSERAFSYSGLDDVARRNRINPVLFSALQILKGAYRNGRISASKEVAEQARKLFAAMDILEESDDE